MKRFLLPRRAVASVTVVGLALLSAPLFGQGFDFALAVGGDAGAVDVVADGGGDVYVTGPFSGSVDLDPGPGIFELSGGDAFLAKYNSSGAFLWALSPGGSALALDASGNVYVTGFFSGTTDFDPGPGVFELTGGGGFLAKYDGSGNFLWAIPTGVGKAVATDGSNVYVTGSDLGSVDLDPGPDVFALGSDGTFVAKYDGSGVFQWAFAVHFDVRDIATDSSGNSHLTGSFEGTKDFDPGPATFELSSSGEHDAFVAKYDTVGNFVWAFALGGVSQCRDVQGAVVPCDRVKGSAIAVDTSANVYVTGVLGTSDFGQTSLFEAKYDSLGNLLWMVQPGLGLCEDVCPGPDDDLGGPDIAVDASGNAYVSGVRFSRLGTARFLQVEKRDTEGDVLWAFDREAGFPSRIAADDAGSAYVVGGFEGMVDFALGPDVFELTSENGGDVYLAKYSDGPVCEAESASPLPEDCDGIMASLELDATSSVDPLQTGTRFPISFHWTTDCPGGTFSVSCTNDVFGSGNDVVVFDGACTTVTLSLPVEEALKAECTVTLSVGCNTDFNLVCDHCPSRDFLIDVSPCAGGQVPGDCNQDGTLDVSDVHCTLNHLFLDASIRLPCGDGSAADSGNRLLLSWKGADAEVDLSAVVRLLTFLFLGGPGHALGTECVPIVGCPVACQAGA